MLRSRSGRRSSGLSAGVGPPRVRWLPPPVPVWVPSSANFSVPRPDPAGGLVERRWCGRHQLGPRARRVDVDLDHAGVRGDDEAGQAGVGRRGVALDDDRLRGARGGGLDGGDAARRRGRPPERRQEDVDVPVAQLDAQGGDRRRLGHLGLVRLGALAAPLRRPRHDRAGAGAAASRVRRRSARTRRGRGPGERVERQAQAHRRVAGDQEQARRGAASSGRSPAARRRGSRCSGMRIAARLAARRRRARR